MRFMVSAMMLLSLMITGHAAECLLYDHDDDANMSDPLGEGWVGSEFGIRRALNNLGHTVSVMEALPTDLSGYDIIFICTGWYGG